jgi:sigma-E factor negative regulatory protein RseB
MSSLRRALCLSLCLVSTAALADDAFTWLTRMNQAARSVNYTGVFVYQSRGHSETSRIFHVVDASGEHERMETLDGPMREVVRNNEDVQCFLPLDRIVVNDKVILGRQPGRLMSKPAALAEFYNIRLGEVSRVAGRDVQQIVLEPRDDMRYGHQLWIDLATGLLLKARMVTDQAEPIEQFRFTEVAPGINIDHDLLKPKTPRTGDWRVVNARGQELRPEELDWVFHKLPSGFRNVLLVRRAMRRNDPGAVHAVFSDGMANISVFIEAISAGIPNMPTSAGPTGIFRRTIGDRMVTVVGEVPTIALKRLAEGVERRTSP